MTPTIPLSPQSHSQVHLQPCSSPLVAAEKIALQRGNRLLFRRLSFSLTGGQAIHLVGDNGSGKTSLLKLLLGFLSPHAGTITRVSADAMLYLGHDTPIKPVLTVAENIAFNSRLFDQYVPDNDGIAAALSAVRLSAFAEQTCGKLSAGQQRRVLLARLWLMTNAVQTRKPLWLLDEPLTALDKHTALAVQYQIAHHLTLGGGVILTSHRTPQLQQPMQTLDLGNFQ